MKKIVFAIGLLASVSVAFASTSKSGPNYKHQCGHSSSETNKKVHHAHIVVPVSHYNI